MKSLQLWAGRCPGKQASSCFSLSEFPFLAVAGLYLLVGREQAQTSAT